MSSKGVGWLDHSGLSARVSKKCLIWTYIQKGKVPVDALAVRLVYEMNRSSLRKCPTLTFGCGHMSFRKVSCNPGVKSGLSLSGVIGPMINEILCLLQVFWKEASVGQINGWELYVGGICLKANHGAWSSRKGDMDVSNWTQSLILEWIFQSMILVKWQACWYFLKSGRPKPPLSLGIVSFEKLNLGRNVCQINSVHALW